MERINQVWLSLGSNLGDRLQFLTKAISLINDELGTVKRESKIYETPALGFVSDSPFLNMCVKVETMKNPIDVLQGCKTIENQLGRKEKTTGEYNSRVIDIDIIFYNRLILNSAELCIPHKEFRNRQFVLQPLCDLEINLLDPVTHLTVSQLLVNCDDKSTITLFEN